LGLASVVQPLLTVLSSLAPFSEVAESASVMRPSIRRTQRSTRLTESIENAASVSCTAIVPFAGEVEVLDEQAPSATNARAARTSFGR
jgi:hypothetical protein